MRKLWKILGLIGERKRYLFWLTLRAPVDFFLNLIQLIFLSNAFISIERGDNSGLTHICLIYGLASVCLFSYNSIVWRKFSVMYTQIAGKIRIAAANSLIKHSLSEVEKDSSGDFLTKLNLDAGMTIMILGGALNIPHFINALVNVIINSILLFGTNIQMALIVFGFMIPHVFINQFAVSRPMTALQDKVLQEKSKLNTTVSAMISMGDCAALYDANPMLLHSFQKQNMEILRFRMKMIIRNALGSGLIPLFCSLGFLVLLLYAGNDIASKKMLFGELNAITKLQGGIMMGLFMGIRSSIHIRMNMAGLNRMTKLLANDAK